MMLFRKKNESEEFKVLEEYKHNIFSIMNKEAYLSKKEYLPFVEKARETFLKLVLLDNSSKLVSWCRKEKTEYADLKELMDFFRNTDSLIKNHNDAYFSRHLMIDKVYLDSIAVNDNYDLKLTNEQREVLLTDEDHTLIIADQGKTTALEAKIRYLVDKKHIDPGKILIITYTKKAYKDLLDRFRVLNIPVIISTFHLLYTVIGNYDGKMPKVASEDLLYKSVCKYFEDNIDNEVFVRQVVLFVTSYLETYLGEDDIELFYEELRRNNTTTLKNDIYNKEEKVRSPLESKVANYLYINGINYEYAPLYKYGFNDSLDNYYPDFFVKQGRKELYIDYFGITESGISNRFTDEEIRKYQKAIRDRIELHKQHGTTYIPLYTKYNDNRDTLEHLKEELINNGITLEDHSRDIYRNIINDKYVNKFIDLICVFISRFKIDNYNSTKFDEWINSRNDERTKIFLDICYKCYIAYIGELKNSFTFEYEDLSNNTLSALDKIIDSGIKLPFEYIFVDEYQDIVLHKYDLCGKLAKCSDGKLIALGDDVETRYGFEDGKIDIYRNFDENVGYSKIIRGYSGGLREAKESPLVLVSYNDNKLGETLEKLIDKLVASVPNMQTILIVGRFGYEGTLIEKHNNIFSSNNGIIRCSKYPSLQIFYSTIHSIKGYEYDNVIFLGDLDIVNPYDPLLRLVDKDIVTSMFEETKKALYIAINRTKNKVYVLDNRDNTTRFMLDFKDRFKDISYIDIDNEVLDVGDKHNCPRCGYPLQKRKTEDIKKVEELWFCSNDSEVCGFVTNDVDAGNMGVCKCPKCDGYLVVKKNKKGVRRIECSNYKKSGSGCNVTLEGIDYLNKEDLDMMFFDEKTDINKLYYIGRPYKELVDSVMGVINYFMGSEILLSHRLLFSILAGEMTDEVKSFNLMNNPKFGYISSKDMDKFYKLYNSMIFNNIIYEDGSEGMRLKNRIDTLEDIHYRNIYASLK